MNKKAGIRFNPEYYVDVNMDDMMLKVETPSGVTEYPLSGGGGQWSEELIWENPDTSVECPETYLNTVDAKPYEYIKIEYKLSISDSDIDKYTYIFDRTNARQSSSNWVGIIGASGTGKRGVQVLTNGYMRILKGYAWNSNTEANDKIIPLSIYGIKREV